jgi:hypothetical protein
MLRMVIDQARVDDDWEVGSQFAFERRPVRIM